MMIHDITSLAGKYKARKRVGRGEGSGHGKQSGRGNKGAGSRSGTSAKKGFEGGQMRYFRRLPKFGFTNAPFKVKFWTVNIGDIIAHADFAKGGEVSTNSLIKAGLVRDDSRDLKILGSLPKGSSGLKVKLNVTASRVSANAKKMIEGAGGKVTQSGTRRDRTRGVDLNNPEAAPKNLTKKLKRNTANKAKIAALPKGSQKKDAGK
jgi:large subunit ribosomal protein L15